MNTTFRTAATQLASVGIVVPCHNYARYLPQCLDSVLSQDGVKLQVLVVDDASSDGSSDIAASYARRDERVRVIVHGSNKGHIHTYNQGLSLVEGDYLVLLSADDALAPGSLKRATDILQNKPRVGFSYGPVQVFSDQLPEAPRFQKSGRVRIWSGPRWLQRRSRLMVNCVVSPEVVMRREMYESAGPYNPSLPHTGDMALWMRAAARGDVAFLHGPPAAYYRRHAGNMHRDVFRSGSVEGMLVDLRQRRMTADAVFADMQGKQSVKLHDTARISLAREALRAASRAYTWGLTEEWPVSDLVDFAAGTWPWYKDLPQFSALKRRISRGPEAARHYPPYVATEKFLEIQDRWLVARQKWTGS